MIRTLRDTGSQWLIPVDVDGATYSLISDDCVIDKGDNFEISTSTGSLTASFSGGSQAIIGGNAFWLTDTVEVTLPANSTIYLCARINPSLPSGQTGSFEALTEVQIQKGNVNEGEIRDLLLYIIETSSSGVSSVEDKRYIVSKGGNGNITTKVLNQGQTEITIEDSRINKNSALSFYTSIYGVIADSAVVEDGSVTLVFSAQDEDMTVGVKVDGTF